MYVFLVHVRLRKVGCLVFGEVLKPKEKHCSTEVLDCTKQ